MVIHCQNDYGTLLVTFNGLECNLCDNASCQIFEDLSLRLNNFGLVFDMDYFDIDTTTGVVSVFSDDSSRSFVPIFTMSVRKIFKAESNLCKLYNMFAPKRLQINSFHSGKCEEVENEFSAHAVAKVFASPSGRRDDVQKV